MTAEARSRVATADIAFVSAASAWEAAIKASLGRLELPDTFEAGVASGFEKLLITFAHAELAAALPVHHRVGPHPPGWMSTRRATTRRAAKENLMGIVFAELRL